MLHSEEINKLIGKGGTTRLHLVPLNLHYKAGRVELDFALGRGKKLHDKRDTARDKDWAREKERLMKHDTRGPPPRGVLTRPWPPPGDEALTRTRLRHAAAALPCPHTAARSGRAE